MAGTGKPRQTHELLVTRDGRLQRVPKVPAGKALADAATRPLNLLALAGMSAASIVLGFPFSIALVIYGLFVLASFVERRTQRVEPGSVRVREALLRLPPTLRTRVSSVLAVADRVRADLDDLPYEPEGVRDGLDQLTVALVETAQRAADVDRYLHTVDRGELAQRTAIAADRAASDPSCKATADALAEQLAVVDRLAGQREQLDAQMEHIAASLGVIQARVVQTRVESDAPIEIQHELSALRDRTRAIAESFSEVDSAAASMPVEVPEQVEQ